MRIGFITTMAATPWGGSEEIWVDMAAKCAPNHQVGVSFYDWKDINPKIKALDKQGVLLHSRKRIFYDNILGKVKGKLRQLFTAQNELKNFTEEGDYEITIISMGSFADLEIDPFRKFLKETNRKYILIVHVNPSDYDIDANKRIEIKEVCKKADQVLFVSNELRTTAERQIDYDFNNGGIVANPINMSEIGVLDYPGMEPIQMAVVGRIIVDIKGHDLLLKILSQDKWKSRNWILNIYGEGPDKDLVKDLAQENELTERVIFKGLVNDIRNDIWKNNHLLLMPSYYEGMPLALIEAMLCGRTAVVSDVGGASDLIDDGVEGFISKENTIELFEEALEKSWAKKDEWDNMGKLSFDRAHFHFDKYSVENVFPELFNVTLTEGIS